VAYLQGLSAGLDLNAESKEGKLLKGIIDVLDEFAESLGDLENSQDQLEDYLESIDEDLYTLEGEVYEDEDLDHDGCGEDYLEVDCPKCGETVCFDSDIIEDDDIVEVTCPNCDEVVFVNDDSYRTANRPGLIQGRMEGSRMAMEEEDI
jgi:hypothetical protein